MDRIRARLGATQEQLAHLLAVSWPGVSRWERGVARPDPMLAEKLDHLAHIRKLLEGVIVKDDMRRWLESPHPALRWHRPIDLLSNTYGFEEVRNLIESIKAGQYACRVPRIQGAIETEWVEPVPIPFGAGEGTER